MPPRKSSSAQVEQNWHELDPLWKFFLPPLRPIKGVKTASPNVCFACIFVGLVQFTTVAKKVGVWLNMGPWISKITEAKKKNVSQLGYLQSPSGIIALVPCDVPAQREAHGITARWILVSIRHACSYLTLQIGSLIGIFEPASSQPWVAMQSAG